MPKRAILEDAAIGKMDPFPSADAFVVCILPLVIVRAGGAGKVVTCIIFSVTHVRNLDTSRPALWLHERPALCWSVSVCDRAPARLSVPLAVPAKGAQVLLSCWQGAAMLEEMIDRGPLLLFGVSAMGAGWWHVSSVRQAFLVLRVRGREARMPELPYRRGGTHVVFDEQFDGFQLLFSRVHLLPPNRDGLGQDFVRIPLLKYSLDGTQNYIDAHTS